MRKLLIIFLIVLLVALIVTIVINGLQIGNFQVYSYSQIKEKNDELVSRIEETRVLTSITYPEKISELNNTAKQLTTVKEQYEDKIAYSTPEEIQKAKELTEFKLSFLSLKLGNYATKNGIDLSLQYVSDSTGEAGDLHFSVKGKYYPISQFVRNIEDDKDLYFKIENFTLLPNSSTEILEAEFNVKGIKLDVDETIANPTIEEIADKQEDTKNNNNNNNSNNS